MQSLRKRFAISKFVVKINQNAKRQEQPAAPTLVESFDSNVQFEIAFSNLSVSNSFESDESSRRS